MSLHFYTSLIEMRKSTAPIYHILRQNWKKKLEHIDALDEVTLYGKFGNSIATILLIRQKGLAGSSYRIFSDLLTEPISFFFPFCVFFTAYLFYQLLVFTASLFYRLLVLRLFSSSSFF